MKSKKADIVEEPVEKIIRTILVIRGKKVILDADLATLYGVPTKRLNEQVKRNQQRFPEDFMFQLSRDEYDALIEYGVESDFTNRSQIATGSQKHRDPRYPPYVFTEYGALMAANVLNSPKAAQMSVFIIRAFVKLREIAQMNTQLARKIAQLERRMGEHDKVIVEIVRELRRMLEAPKPLHQRRQIGFIKSEGNNKK